MMRQRFLRFFHLLYGYKDLFSGKAHRALTAEAGRRVIFVGCSCGKVWER